MGKFLATQVAGIECLPETPWGPPRAWGAGEGAVVVCALALIVGLLLGA